MSGIEGMPYRYFFAYVAANGSTGNEEFSRSRPMIDMSDVVAVQRDIEAKLNCGPVCVTGWQQFSNATEW